MASAWVGFWAKLGWFNVVLPGPVYGAFLPATIAAIIGLFTVIRSPRRSGGGWILATIVLTNFALLIVYLVAVDWQPQGRYLLPSSAALAGLAATGLERISIGWRPRTSSAVAMASVTLSLVAAVAAVLVVVRVYGL